ncbi:hypothetical protein [Streptomyces sp. NPDC058092]|uniref:hypothetical protein n=1 Tax=Streptomyces sp. NPDC058092 TaxID=3346336 RepID=UPI0036ECF9B4
MPADLNSAERQFLTFALDLAADKMACHDGFTEEDEAALETFRRMADETADAAQLARFEDARHTLQQTRESARPPLKSRLAMLLAHIEEQGGEWTTKRTQRLYRDNSAGAPFRATARKDLHALAALGWLVHDTTDPGRHCYRLNHAKAGAR